VRTLEQIEYSSKLAKVSHEAVLRLWDARKACRHNLTSLRRTAWDHAEEEKTGFVLQERKDLGLANIQPKSSLEERYCPRIWGKFLGRGDGSQQLCENAAPIFSVRT
jgi:hypothetical protein